MIPDKAVEALARVLANEALYKADMDGFGWDAEVDSSDRFMPSARTKARRYLEAALPFLTEPTHQPSTDWPDIPRSRK